MVSDVYFSRLRFIHTRFCYNAHTAHTSSRREIFETKRLLRLFIFAFHLRLVCDDYIWRLRFIHTLFDITPIRQTLVRGERYSRQKGCRKSHEYCSHAKKVGLQHVSNLLSFYNIYKKKLAHTKARYRFCNSAVS